MDKTKRKKDSQKITIIGAIINFLLALFKVIAGFIGNSSALIADGVHSFSDLVSDGIVWYAAKHSNEDPDDEHPYGHERFETVATLGLGIILALIGVGVIIDAIDKLLNPSILTHNALMLSVVILSISAKEVLYWWTLKVAKTYKSKMLEANAWHHRSDALSSVVVFIGILGSINGFLYFDGAAAIVVGLMIIYIAWGLGFGAVSELVDSSIGGEKIKKLKTAIKQIDDVVSLHSLRTRKNGHKISADVHVQVEPFLSVSEGHIISVSVEHAAKKCLNNLTDVTVHIDPEDDEISIPYEDLPERSHALKILNKSLIDNQCGSEITDIKLHYLDGKIQVDFYLPLSCLKSDKSYDEILYKLQKIVNNLDSFDKVKVYFGKTNTK